MKKFKSWFTGLTRTGKVLTVAGGLLLVGGMGNAMASPQTPAPVTDTAQAETTKPAEKPKAEPKITTKTISNTSSVGYKTKTVKDSSMAKGTKTTQTAGVKGKRTTKYKVTYVDGMEVDREKLSSKVTTQPITKVVVIGTYVKPKPKPTPKPAKNCDPNYSGCVPIASDVDCPGGSGNGPAYASGVVRVTGVDIYDLDRDGDGYGCD